jgi:hypothetical protein
VPCLTTCAACTIRWRGDDADRVPGVWHRPTVQAAARLDDARFRELNAVLRDRGMIGSDIHSYGTLTVIGEEHARERWDSSRPPGALAAPGSRGPTRMPAR